jgi:hypothetical protein
VLWWFLSRTRGPDPMYRPHEVDLNPCPCVAGWWVFHRATFLIEAYNVFVGRSSSRVVHICLKAISCLPRLQLQRQFFTTTRAPTTKQRHSHNCLRSRHPHPPSQDEPTSDFPPVYVTTVRNLSVPNPHAGDCSSHSSTLTNTNTESTGTRAGRFGLDQMSFPK